MKDSIEAIFDKLHKRNVKRKYTLCVEIGRITLRYLVTKAGGDNRPTIQEQAVHELPDAEIDSQITDITGFIDSLVKKYDNDCALHISLNRAELVYHNISLPEGDPAGDESVLAQVCENLEIEQTEYYFDIKRLGQAGVQASHENILVSGIPKDLLNALFAMQATIGQIIESVQVSPFMVINLVNRLLTAEDEVIMVLRASVEHPRFYLVQNKKIIFVRNIDLIDRITDQSAVRMAVNEVQQSFSYFSFYISQSTVKEVDRIYIYDHPEVAGWMREEMEKAFQVDVSLFDIHEIDHPIQGLPDEMPGHYYGALGLLLDSDPADSYIRYYQREKTPIEKILSEPLGLLSAGLTVFFVLCMFIMLISNVFYASGVKKEKADAEYKVNVAQEAKIENEEAMAALKAGITQQKEYQKQLQKDLKSLRSLEKPGKKVSGDYRYIAESVPDQIRIKCVTFKEGIHIEGEAPKREHLAAFVENLKSGNNKGRKSYRIQRLSVSAMSDAPGHRFVVSVLP